MYIKTYITVVKKDMMNSMYEIISHTLKLFTQYNASAITSKFDKKNKCKQYYYPQ